jgi:NAD(P)-dependent dehydrogenase (short-subunit alcohol dehydrogenase family)
VERSPPGRPRRRSAALSLAGRNAVVTGGASGIGRSICLRLARDGADVAVLDLDAAGAGRVGEEVRAAGRRALAVEADVASWAAVARAVAEVHRQLGRVQILINDAGIAGFTPFLEMTEAAWDGMIAVHLKGTFNCSRALLPDMVAAGWGRIVNVSSGAAFTGGPGLVHYAAAKAGMLGFTRCLAREVGPHGVTVNAIAPGVIDTPMLRRSGFPESALAAIVSHTPVGRMGTPDDVAAACAYLVSEEAGFVTGQVVCPSGGEF